MFALAMLLAVAAPAEPSLGKPASCPQYAGRTFRGRIRNLRLRRSTPKIWSAEDQRCGRLFFPAKLSRDLETKAARALAAAVNSHRVASDAFVEIDAVVRIAIYPDHSGGDLTVLAIDKASPR